MIVTSRFCFLHLHKSGGTFVNDCLLRFIPGARQIGYHLPRRLIPENFAHLPVLGFVRNPWSYYVSWYSFQSARPQPNALFRILSDCGRLDFEPTISRMLHLSEDDALLDEIISALPSAYGRKGLNLPGPVLAEIRGTGLGFYSFLYRYLYEGGNSPLHVGRMENLRSDLLALLGLAGQEIGDDLRRHVQEASARNSSRHDAYREYYNQALEREVADRDTAIITAHGYRFSD